MAGEYFVQVVAWVTWVVAAAMMSAGAAMMSAGAVMMSGAAAKCFAEVDNMLAVVACELPARKAASCTETFLLSWASTRHFYHF